MQLESAIMLLARRELVEQSAKPALLARNREVISQEVMHTDGIATDLAQCREIRALISTSGFR